MCECVWKFWMVNRVQQACKTKYLNGSKCRKKMNTTASDNTVTHTQHSHFSSPFQKKMIRHTQVTHTTLPRLFPVPQKKKDFHSPSPPPPPQTKWRHTSDTTTSVTNKKCVYRDAAAQQNFSTRFFFFVVFLQHLSLLSAVREKKKLNTQKFFFYGGGCPQRLGVRDGWGCLASLFFSPTPVWIIPRRENTTKPFTSGKTNNLRMREERYKQITTTSPFTLVWKT